MSSREECSVSHLDQRVARAQLGERVALEELVQLIQNDIFRLCLRMSVDHEEARNATQEILILIVTKLSTFAGNSAFRTWAYRVALNYLLGEKRKRPPQLTFEAFEADLMAGLDERDEPPTDPVLLNEVRVGCTMAMLLCLDERHRAAYVLGEIFELDHQEASDALGVSPDTFRKQLSRARQKVFDFTQRVCGLANHNAPCHCSRRIAPALAAGCIAPEQLLFGLGAPEFDRVQAEARELASHLVATMLQKSVPKFESPRDVAATLARLFHSVN